MQRGADRARASEATTALLHVAKAACPATAAGSAAAAAAAAAWSGWPTRSASRPPQIYSSLKLLCAFKHHGQYRSAAPSGTIFAYCLFVNIHLLEKGTLLQISRNRLPPVKSNNCYNVRKLCSKHCVFIIFWLACRHTWRHRCPYWNHHLCV